ncbi:MAG: hypothetical protein J0I84_07840 [Terrimonas sp.]|nr:hypothetical protein [Terrimonas sp.]OJY87210.1 MAG: hypothetical protein BGP13_14680 [Sphingobacteriales bacterium 40-81]
MKKCIPLLIIAGFVITQHAIAQDEDQEPVQKGFDKSKLFFGGNFGLGFGTNTSVNISPQIGYRFNDYLAAGAGVNFNYYSYKYYNYDGSGLYRESLGYTGFNVFGRIYPIKFILLQAQPELNYSWGSRKFYDGSEKQKLAGQFTPSLLIGGGAAIPMGGRNGALLLMLQYDILQQKRSPYGNRPFFSMGYNF